MTHSISINGKTHELDVDDDTPMLWVLRYACNLTGTKYVCGIAMCGACTIELEVPQCGYCQSGQLMSAAVLLETNHALSDADIDAVMAGNLCRCGTYGRIRAGIRLAGSLLVEARR